MAPGPQGSPLGLLRLRFSFLLACTFAAIAIMWSINSSVFKDGLGLSIEGNAPAKFLWSFQNSVAQKSSHKKVAPLVQLLRYANVTLSQREMKDFPSWKEVVSRFGENPRILGLDRCGVYRRAVPFLKERVLAPAGVFNSGTNLLFELLAKNCKVPGRNQNTTSKYGVDWQVNWGKHQSPRFRLEHHVKYWKNNSLILPIVVVRDPWTWFQSMCRQNYAAIWYHVVGPEGHCPNFVPSDVERKWFHKSKSQIVRYFEGDKSKARNVIMKANFTLDMKTIPVAIRYKKDIARHQSLVHFWKEWYQEYYDASFPRLMIRLEDLVFHPYETLKSGCDCVGGVFSSKTKFSLRGESVKNVSMVAHSKTLQTNLKSAFFLHLRSNRTQGMTFADIEFARSVLDDSLVRQFFGYMPPSATK